MVLGVVWLQLSSRWWQPRTYSIAEGSLAQGMGRGRWRVDVLSGCMFLDTWLFYGLSVRSLPLPKQNLSPTQRLGHNVFRIPDGQGEQAGKEKWRLEWS